MIPRERTIMDIIRDRSLFMCVECGKCSASCPRMLAGKEYSPRLLAQKLISEPEDERFIENSVWECLTCGLCEERCPSGVEYCQFILEMRTLLARTKGLRGYRAHDGALHSWMRMMTSPDLEQNRLDWVGEELKVARTGPVAFFTGCAPYFDAFFSGIDVHTMDIVRDSIRLLNFLDIEPVLLAEERCCGHDLLWSGDRENFATLCELNYQEFKKAGVEEVLVSCPECFYVLSRLMPEFVRGFDLKITLLSELVLREINKGGLSFKPFPRQVTFQDPCRLGRTLGRHREPRELMAMVPEMNLQEMENKGPSAICCGNNGFINCDAFSKRIQVERLKEARATGADLLLTACPKCMIHLTCVMRDPSPEGAMGMEIRDLVSVLADSIEWSEGKKIGAGTQKKP